MGALKGPAVADNPESRKIPNSVQAVVVVVVVYDARVLRWWCRCRVYGFYLSVSVSWWWEFQSCLR